MFPFSIAFQSRAHLPDSIGAVTWVAPYAPHHRYRMHRPQPFPSPLQALSPTPPFTATHCRNPPPHLLLHHIPPHINSTFVPIYASAAYTPPSMNVGTQYKFEKKSNWWIHCMTSNYLSRWYVLRGSVVVK